MTSRVGKPLKPAGSPILSQSPVGAGINDNSERITECQQGATSNVSRPFCAQAPIRYGSDTFYAHGQMVAEGLRVSELHLQVQSFPYLRPKGGMFAIPGQNGLFRPGSSMALLES